MNEYTYELIVDAGIVLRSDGASIPLDESNSDYQAYLASLEKQQAALNATIQPTE